MIYYHYTPLKAFSSILQDNPTKGKEICFWQLAMIVLEIKQSISMA